MIRVISVTLCLAFTAAVARAHGDHVEEFENPDATYAELHMASEHHMDNFDIQAFFHLHDLNRDGILDVNELESIYGVHHEKRKKLSGGDMEVHTEKAKEIVQTVLQHLDKNGDGVLTMREFVAGGVGGLPNFKGVEHLGHHYDAEGEYFLHHEEKYHNSPETQNEEDYIHPEDIEHFMAHEAIEAEEEVRVKEFTGENPGNGDSGSAINTGGENVQQVLGGDGSAFGSQSAAVGDRKPGRLATPPSDPSSPPVWDNIEIRASDLSDDEIARQERAAYARKQAEKFSKAAKEASKRGEWGSEGTGFKRPKDAADRLRSNIPYKYKVRKSWFGEF